MRTLLLPVVFLGLLAGRVSAQQTCIPDMPVPHANNAVTSVTLHNQIHLFSFAGLKAGKTWKDTSKEAWMYVEGREHWERLPDLPVELGRLAATVEVVGETVYYFGGYTVAEDGGEVSTPENFAYNPYKRTYKRIADMPVPVDDAISFVYQNRYVYLLSGWHNEGNVRDVQYYDTETNIWMTATDYPGSPVFGHAGGIVGSRFVVADGVAVVGKDENGRRQFDTVNEGWLGTIDPKDPSKIEYRRLPQLPGRGHYRMGGAGDEKNNRVLFVGGTPNAYNYSGIGYNGEPSVPQKHVFAWDFTKDNWVAYQDKQTASMDHRGLLNWHGEWITVGGMAGTQKVTGKVFTSLGTDELQCD